MSVSVETTWIEGKADALFIKDASMNLDLLSRDTLQSAGLLPMANATFPHLANYPSLKKRSIKLFIVLFCWMRRLRRWFFLLFSGSELR